MGHARLAATISAIEATVLDVAKELKLDPARIRGPESTKDRVHARARAEVWRRVCRPDVSIASVARAWPCNNTSIMSALAGGKGAG